MFADPVQPLHCHHRGLPAWVPFFEAGCAHFKKRKCAGLGGDALCPRGIWVGSRTLLVRTHARTHARIGDLPPVQRYKVNK